MDTSQYLDLFIDETKEHLQSLNEHVLVLEKEPENEDTINEIFRAAHTLKGMSGTMGFVRMQRLTHDLENVFSEIRNGNMKVNEKLIDVLFRGLDALESYLAVISSEGNEGTEDNEDIINDLNALLEEQSGDGAAAPAQKEVKKEETPAKEEKAENKQESASDEKCKFKQIPISEYEATAINSARAEGKNVYGITVYLQKTCILKSARAFLVFKSVENKGELIKSVPSTEQIEDEEFDFDFSWIFASSDTKENIKKLVMNVSEIAEVYIDDIEIPDAPAAGPSNDVKPAQEKKETAKPDVKEKPKKASASKGKVGSRSVRVDIDKLDVLMNLVSELIIAKNGLVSAGAASPSGQMANAQAFHEQIEYLERVTTNLHESVMKVRMVPIESVVNKFPRMIRDLSRTLDKKMELVMTGEDTELDRTVVDQIGDPLQHLLRNSADHGLEDTELRIQRGKPEVGNIFLNAYQEGNNVIIQVGDDGNGIDTEAVKAKAIERNIITPEQAEVMTQKEIINLLFMPSFSMAKKITDISGRGVGLDVVKSNIEQLGGDVEVKTKLGEGTTFTVRLPLTLAIIQALMVEVRDEKYAIALGSIANIESVPVSSIKYVEAKEVIHLRGSVIPLVRLDKLLDIEPREEEPESLTVVIVKKGDSQVGLVVDDLMGQQEIVIKSLGKYINGNKLISGATILGDGEVALILDANTLM